MGETDPDSNPAEVREAVGAARAPGPAQAPGAVEALRAAVVAFEALTPRERISRTRFLEEIDRLPRPLDRHADLVHVTGSAIVIGTRGTVLHRHKRLHRWLQPGGHLEPGESPAAGALREAEEETGLKLRHPEAGPHLVHIDVHPAGEHVHLDTRYLLLSEDIDPKPAVGESQQVGWFALDDAIAAADEGLADALRRVRASGPGGVG